MRAAAAAAAAFAFALVGCAGEGGREAREATTTTRTAPATTTTGTAPATTEERSQPNPPPHAPAPQEGDDLRAVGAAIPSDPFLSEVASDLTAPEVKVHCWSEEQWRKAMKIVGDRRVAGLADIVTFRIDLAPWVCRELAAVREAGEVPEDRNERLLFVDALVVLAHEAQHLTQAGGNEAVAECYAIQKTRDAARAFGASEEEAADLAGLAWSEIYGTLPDEYRSAQCHEGGPLDLNPETSEWP